jgi:hypothetical protein
MTVDRKQRYIVIAKRGGVVVESGAAEGEHLLPTVMAHLALKHLGSQIIFRKVLDLPRPHKVGHLHLVRPPAPEPTSDEAFDAILRRVLGGAP